MLAKKWRKKKNSFGRPSKMPANSEEKYLGIIKFYEHLHIVCLYRKYKFFQDQIFTHKNILFIALTR